MHLARSLQFKPIAGALVGSGCVSKRARRAAAAPENPGPQRAASAVPPAGRRPDPPQNADKTFLDLIAAGVIEATARGSSMRHVEVSIENRGGTSLSFIIPIGTFFESGGTVFQSMITTFEHRVTLAPHGALTTEVGAACANRDLRAPRSFDTFQEIREPPDPRLATALWGLDRHGASSHARQAAVWIMTNDARWEGFGTRISGETMVPYATEDEAALAMVAIDLNGVDITSKAIWEDVPMIRAGVVDPDLKAWLEIRC